MIGEIVDDSQSKQNPNPIFDGSYLIDSIRVDRDPRLRL